MWEVASGRDKTVVQLQYIHSQDILHIAVRAYAVQREDMYGGGADSQICPTGGGSICSACCSAHCVFILVHNCGHIEAYRRTLAAILGV